MAGIDVGVAVGVGQLVMNNGETGVAENSMIKPGKPVSIWK